MSKKECIKFGYAIGNMPAMGDHWEVWKQVKAQSKLILEEVEELEDACSEEDLLEVLDDGGGNAGNASLFGAQSLNFTGPGNAAGIVAVAVMKCGYRIIVDPEFKVVC